MSLHLGEPNVNCYSACLWSIAICSDFIKELKSIKPGSLVVLICRVSRLPQYRKGNLKAQELFLKSEAEKLGCKVIHVHCYVGSGYDPYLDPAVEIALQNEASLVALTVDRFIRPESYKGKHDKTALLKVRHLKLLKHLTKGLPLYTYMDPDCTPGDSRSLLTKIGQLMKSRGGRPTEQRIKFKKKWRPIAIELRKEGLSYEEIAKKIRHKSSGEISKWAIRNWLTFPSTK